MSDLAMIHQPRHLASGTAPYFEIGVLRVLRNAPKAQARMEAEMNAARAQAKMLPAAQGATICYGLLQKSLGK